MKARDEEAARRAGRGLTAVNGVIALVTLLLIAQMWLLTASLEAYLAGHYETALPGAIVSGILFLACAALYWFIVRVDARGEEPK